MNNGNSKTIGLHLLEKTQILSQNNAITTEERIQITKCIQEGMKSGTFESLESFLWSILSKTSLPNVVECMLIML